MTVAIPIATKEFAQALADLPALADQIFFEVAPTIDRENVQHPERVREKFSADQLAVFAQLGLTDTQIRNEILRVWGVMKFQELAGTSRDRERAERALRSAEDAFSERAPKIEAEIERIRNELNSLQDARQTAREKVKQHHEAVARLRGLCPQFIRDEHDKARRALGPRRRAGLDVTQEMEAANVTLDFYAR